MPIHPVPSQGHRSPLSAASRSDELYTVILQGRQFTITSLDIVKKRARVQPASYRERVVYAETLRQEYLLPAGDERDSRAVEDALGMFLRNRRDDIQILRITPALAPIAPYARAESTLHTIVRQCRQVT